MSKFSSKCIVICSDSIHAIEQVMTWLRAYAPSQGNISDSYNILDHKYFGHYVP